MVSKAIVLQLLVASENDNIWNLSKFPVFLRFLVPDKCWLDGGANFFSAHLLGNSSRTNNKSTVAHIIINFINIVTTSVQSLSTYIACLLHQQGVCEQLISHALAVDALPDEQFGFIPGRSTVWQLIQVLEDW